MNDASTSAGYVAAVPRGRKPVWLLLALLAVPCLTFDRAVAQQQPRFRAEINLVQLQVGVANANGEFVSGLSADDFVVVVDGDPRACAVAYEVDLRTEALAGGDGVLAPRKPLRQRPMAARRHFLFFFDFRYTTRRGLREARRAALEFLDSNVRTSDVLAVATVNRYGIDLPIPFAADVARARAVIEDISLKDVTDAAVGDGVAASAFAGYAAEVSQYVQALAWLAEMLRAVEGRKHLVMFSKGFADEVLVGADLDTLSSMAESRASGGIAGYVVPGGDPAYLSGSEDVRRDLEATVEALLEAEVVVHAVDPRGLRDEQDGHQALVFLASGTGGEAYWNMNDLTVALEQIDAATNRFYMIGYAKKPTDPQAVSIEVRVVRPGVRITSAPTRLAPPPDEDEMTDEQKWLRSGVIQSPS